MKILATSCWHLDLETGGCDRHAEIVDAAQKVIDMCHGVDLVVMLGDLFDNNRPSPRAYATAIRLLGEISAPLLLIPGNHDPDTYAPLEAALSYNAICPCTAKRLGVIGYGDKQFVCVGYCRDKDVLGGAQYAVTQAFERVSMGADGLEGSVRIDAVFTHLNVEGASFSSGGISEAMEPYIPVDVAQKLSCPVVNGHIHRQQRMGNIYMPGSLIRVNYGEAGDKVKGYIELEV